MKKTIKTLMIIGGLFQGTALSAENLRIFSSGNVEYNLVGLNDTRCEATKIEKNQKDQVSCLFLKATKSREILNITSNSEKYACQIIADENGKLAGEGCTGAEINADNTIHLP